jgi:hypothetical protein
MPGSMTDAALGAGAVIGGGGIVGLIKFIWNKREGNVARLEKRVAALEEELRDVWFAFAHVTAALRQREPNDPALRLAAKILKDKFPFDLNIPADMQDQLDRMK